MTRWEDHGAEFIKHAGHQIRYCTRWDAEACITCDLWLEEPCACDPNATDPHEICPFPGIRPAKPSEVA